MLTSRSLSCEVPILSFFAPFKHKPGACPYNNFDARFTPKQPAGDPANMFLLGDWSTTIEYNDTDSFWMMRDQRSGVIAISRATKVLNFQY